MFESGTYTKRRSELKKLVGGGILFFPGNNFSPMNYPANILRYRQDSNFLYYWGLDEDGLCAIIDLDNDKEIIFGNDREIDDVVWMGFDRKLSEKSSDVGVNETKPYAEIANYISDAISSNRKVHYLPAYRGETIIEMAGLFGVATHEVNLKKSDEFVKAVISQRSIKTDEEVKEIEDAIAISYDMNMAAMKSIKPGLVEKEVYGEVEGIALSKGHGVSFPVIFSVHGETLHNHHHDNVMQDGQIAVLDSGAESNLHYASDITRTYPVNGKFSDIQKDIYNIVLNAQEESIKMMKPGVKFRACHIKAAQIIAEGLSKLGLMKGNVEEAVEQGAHALFFPHGLGHMMGLDVHDMEGLGENLVGYDDATTRSKQFGLAYLRMGKELVTGNVMTVEPGIYFIPQLIEEWKAENKFADFLNYDEIEKYKNFGGIRIEDDILVTEDSYKVLGKPIPKTVEEIEAIFAK